MKRQYSFPQRIGKLIENYIIESENLMVNRRQQTKGYFDAYDKDNVYEIKAAKDNNYFRIIQKNHKQLMISNGTYILVKYSLKSQDKGLRVISDINIDNKQFILANNLKNRAIAWLEDQRKNNLFYKVKI